MPIMVCKVSDDGLVSKKKFNPTMACWVGAQVNLLKKVNTCLHDDITGRKPQHKTKKISFQLNNLASGCFQGFSGKKHLNARSFAREFLRSSMLYRLGKSLKRRGKSSSLHSKKNFCLGVRVFCEWPHKWKTFRPPWPTLPGPGRQPLGGRSFYWKLDYNPSLLILWMTCWGFGFKCCDVS